MKRTLSKIVLFSLTIALLLCCGFPALADGPSPCTQCILDIRQDILPNQVKFGDTIPIYDDFPPADDFPVLADLPSPCTQCILGIRLDILPFYEQNGWDISPENQDNIIDNWCSIDPPGCCAAKNSCDAYCELCDVPSPCTQCILGIRLDILPFYEQNGWDISPENQDNIINNWCGIDPVGCCAAKKSYDGHCGMHNTYDFRDQCPGAQEQIDPWNFYKCECVSYCADKLNENGIPFHNYYLSQDQYPGFKWGCASNWKNAAVDVQALHPDKVLVTDTPNVGDIAWFGGHVAYVVHVYPDNYVDVCEYNVNWDPVLLDWDHDFECRCRIKAQGYIRFY